MDAKTAALEYVQGLIDENKPKSPMKNNDKTNYRVSLQQALAAVVPQEEVAEAIHRFDKLAKYGPEMAATVTLKSMKLGEAHASVAEYLARQLAKLGAAPKVETESVKRYRELVIRLNKMIQDGGSAVTVNGKGLSQFEIEQAKIKVAPCMQNNQFTYTATATVNGETVNQFVLETNRF